MTMTISGNGTIAGLSAGGLPAASIQQANLAAGAVTPDKTQVGALPSMVRLNTANGYGSTNTAIRRFTNTVTNQGSDITYADSATLGASFTINANGVYSISYSDEAGTTANYAGASLNTTQPTVTVVNLTNASEILFVVSNQLANYPSHGSWTGYLPAGSVIRPHIANASAGASPNATQFTITRVA